MGWDKCFELLKKVGGKKEGKISVYLFMYVSHNDNKGNNISAYLTNSQGVYIQIIWAIEIRNSRHSSLYEGSYNIIHFNGNNETGEDHYKHFMETGTTL